MAKLSENNVGIGDICTATVGAAMAVASVGCRLWARRITRHRIGWSDVTIVLSLVLALGLVFISICSVVYADAGINTITLAHKYPEKLILLRKYLFIQNIVWVSANTLVRISILLLYIDIFPITKFTRACYVFLALNIAYCLEVIILRLVICVPLSFNWDNNASHGFCRGDVTHAAYVNGVINILLDVFMVMLPMPVLWSLKMATGKKIQLSFVFGLGILICILSVLRVEFVHQTEKLSDTRTYVAFGSLAVLEPLLGIVNACLPFFRSLVSMYWPSKKGEMTEMSAYGTGATSERRAFRPLGDREVELEGRTDLRKVDVYQPPD